MTDRDEMRNEPLDDPHGDPREDRALDARLRAAFAPPPDIGEVARAAVADARDAVSPRPVLRLPRAAAAALLLAALGGILWWAGRAAERSVAPAGSDGAVATHDLDGAGTTDGTGATDGTVACGSVISSIYADVMRQHDEGGLGAGACQVPQDLADLFDERYGSPLYVKIQPERPVLGPVSCEVLPDVTVLCGMKDGRPIPIVVGAPGDGPPPGLESDGLLNCYRRDLGGLVLYELSPLDAPACLDLFSTSLE
ncbi:MAG: hypothetical protein ACYTG2_01065 [Planctomycetota bacterium]|jgi:hypothetical protein